MQMNIHHKRFLLAGLIALVVLAGCKKDDTYYNYDKETSVFEGNSYQYLQKGGGLFDSMLLVINRCTGLKDLTSERQSHFVCHQQQQF